MESGMRGFYYLFWLMIFVFSFAVWLVYWIHQQPSTQCQARYIWYARQRRYHKGPGRNQNLVWEHFVDTGMNK